MELQELLGVSACVLLGELNDRGIPAACEVDVGNAVAMTALHLASGRPATCLDWNNNYGGDEDKCILFHCGPVPRSLMADEGRIADHAIIANSVGPGCGYGCHVGRIAPNDITFGSMLTDSGRLRFYLGEGSFTSDPIAPEFFGCAGVASISGLQDVLLHVGRNGYRHHVSATVGHLAAPVREALELYRGIVAAHPETPEAGYSRTQIQNIVNSVVPDQELLDAQADLALAHMAPQGAPAVEPTPVEPLVSQLAT